MHFSPGHVLGYSAPSWDQQLSTCMQQMQCLLADMGSEIFHITHLEVHVPGSSASSYGDSFTYSPEQSWAMSFSSVDISEAPHSICSVLAPEIPHLQNLRLSGAFCEDVAMTMFAAHCPQLTSLEIEACTVPLEILHRIHLALPNLSHFTLYSPEDGTKQDTLQEYVDSLLPLLKNCTQLAILELNLIPGAKGRQSAETVESASVLMVRPEVWNTLPPSLHELRCDVELCLLLAASGLTSRISVLTLREFPAMSLAQLLDYAPLLQRMTVTSSAAREVYFLLDKVHLSTEELAIMKARLLSGFQLSCPSVYVSGPSESIRDLLSWLPPMEGTSACILNFPRRPRHEDCLTAIGLAFPNLECLSLQDDYEDTNHSLCVQDPLLLSLAQCAHLQHLRLCIPLEFADIGLVSLCLSLPALCTLACMPYEGLCTASVMSELAIRGRQIVITGTH